MTSQKGVVPGSGGECSRMAETSGTEGDSEIIDWMAEGNSEPSADWRDRSNRRDKQARRNERRQRQVLTLNDLFSDPEPYYEKMINIKFVGLDINKNLNVVKANSELDMAVGKLKRMVKAGRETLLVEASSQRQAEKLSRVITIAGHQVKVETHKTLKRIKGVVRSLVWGRVRKLRYWSV